jgi:hypothetical protein
MSRAVIPAFPLEAEGGAVPLNSPFYVVRAADAEFREAVLRSDSSVLVKGARQMGKTSLLARGLQWARDAHARVVLTDFQTLAPEDLNSPEALCLALGGLMAEQLDLETPETGWEHGRGANYNFERYLRRDVLEQVSGPLVWGLDEVDRLFTCPFSDEIFAMFRSWHNRRALEPGGPWSRLTLAISFATEAHLFIRDLNQSPFNVGTRVLLQDFTPAELADLNDRYGRPLRSRSERQRFYALLAGHPFLSRRGLHDLASGASTLEDLEQPDGWEQGPFGEHLRRMLLVLRRDPGLCEAALSVAMGERRPALESFYRLRTAGLVVGEDPESARPRCRLYGDYLKVKLRRTGPAYVD